MTKDQTEESTFKCPWCDSYKHDNRLSVARHAAKMHKKTSQEIYDVFFCKNGRPKCVCGCGEETKFLSIGRGYNKYTNSGHVARVNNAWGHNPQALRKSLETRRKMSANGEIVGWMAGKNKDTDPRIMAVGKKISNILRSDIKHHERASNNMKKLWKEKKIKPLFGKEHPAWKGGFSTLNEVVHSRLYNSWSYPKMAQQNFMCQFCNLNYNLCVHHNEEKFSSILRRAVENIGFNHKIYELDHDMKTKIADEVIRIHIDEDISGLVLCQECHAKEHENQGENWIASLIRCIR